MVQNIFKEVEKFCMGLNQWFFDESGWLYIVIGIIAFIVWYFFFS